MGPVSPRFDLLYVLAGDVLRSFSVTTPSELGGLQRNGGSVEVDGRPQYLPFIAPGMELNDRIIYYFEERNVTANRSSTPARAAILFKPAHDLVDFFYRSLHSSFSVSISGTHSQFLHIRSSLFL